MDLATLGATVGAPFAVVLTTISAIRLVQRGRSSRYKTLNRPYFYEDEDGTATRSSTEYYSDTWPKLQANITATMGLVIAISSAVKIASSHEANSAALALAYTRVASWFFVLAQCSLLLHEPSSIKRVNIGILAAISSAFLLYNLSWELYGFLMLLQTRSGNAFVSLHWSSIASQSAAALLVAYACLSIPRRPDVFHNGEIVDGQNSTSIFSRYTYGWARPMLEKAKGMVQINFQDLPALDHHTRTVDLMRRFLQLKSLRSQPLWRSIYAAHRKTFWWEWTLTAAQSASAYAPQLCLFKTLTLLEKQQLDDVGSSEIWFWAVGIGVVRAIQQALEARLNWVCSSQLEIPIRSQLSAMIFQSSMHKKIIKSHSESNDSLSTPDVSCKVKDSDLASLLTEDESEDSIQMEKMEKQSAPLLKSEEKHPQALTTQATINLLAVDATRVAEFASRQYVFVSIFITIAIAIVVLVRLIGWISMGVSFLAPLALTPLNLFASRAYAVAQGKLMKERDRKVTTVTEAMQGIRQIKFSASELQWHEKIMRTRDSELAQQRKVFMWIIILRFFWISSPILLSLSALATYSWINGSLSPSVAFTALAVFGNLEFSLSLIPFAITQGIDALVSCRRIDRHFSTEKRGRTTAIGDSIEFRDADIAWPTDVGDEKGDRFVLRNINANFPTGALSVISGKSGSGKSLLLSSIIGESDVLAGTLTVPRQPSVHGRYDSKATPENWIIPSALAYVAQIPWIENATLKDNILFGLPFHHERYNATLAATALLEDLEILEDGDLTEIGAQGVNLSGGQRWRVTLARAIYSRAGILVLDDIFSAVDASVGRHIFEECLTGSLCEGRTRIIATHHDSLCLPEATYAVKISNGSLQDITESRLGTTTSMAEKPDESRNDTSSTGTLAESRGDEAGQESPATTPRVYVEEEFRESGHIKWAIYKKYLNSSGGWKIWSIAICVVMASQLALLTRGWWMKLWTEYSQKMVKQYPEGSKESALGGRSIAFYLGIYAAISMAAAFLEAMKCGFVYLAALRASRHLFASLVDAVLKAPLRWLDTIPLGRILSRACADFNLIDARIPGDTHMFLSAIFSLVVISIAGLALSFLMIVPEFILLVICVAYTSKFLHGAREIKRLESVSKSPILELYSTSLAGLDTIRAFDKVEEYISRMLVHLDNQSRSSWSFWLVCQWMAFRMGMVGSLFASFVAFTIAFRNVDASLAGFVLGFALDWTKSMEDAIKRFSNLQLNMNSTERVVEYCDIDKEDYSGDTVPKNWPSEGNISVKDLHVSYGPGLPDVIRGLNIEIAPGQHVGVVGRTGAGKSSLALSLFRFIENRSGSIHIDGIDIAKIKLPQLRASLSIISQDPILFSGTIRSNLDPFGRYSDDRLRECLDRVCLTAQQPPVGSLGQTGLYSNFNLFENLDSSVSEGGLSLSQGQRQLLCLARSMISQSKIMVMDEATSSVDMHTDNLIQLSIAEHFKNTTLLVIAHRLTTVADFDKILVMADGQVVESGEPRRLFESRGEFWKLVMESGEREKIESIILSK